MVAVDDLSGGFVENVPEGAEFVPGSVSDDAFVERPVRGPRFDYVYHLAAYAAEGLSHFIRRFNYTNNLIGASTYQRGGQHDVAASSSPRRSPSTAPTSCR